MKSPDFQSRMILSKFFQPMIEKLFKGGMAGEFLGGPELNRARKDTMRILEGKTLHAGAGTGNDIPFYPPAVTEVVAIDLNPKLKCKELAKKRRLPYTLLAGDLTNPGTFLPLGKFDSACMSLTGCLLSDPAITLGFLLDALKQGGKFALLEHGLNQSNAKAQENAADAWKKVSHGCQILFDWNRLVMEAGFEVEYLEKRETKELLAFQLPLYIIHAVKP